MKIVEILTQNRSAEIYHEKPQHGEANFFHTLTIIENPYYYRIFRNYAHPYYYYTLTFIRNLRVLSLYFTVFCEFLKINQSNRKLLKTSL